MALAVLALIPLLRIVAVAISVLLVVAAAVSTSGRESPPWWRPIVFICLGIDVIAALAVVATYSN